MNYLGLDLGTSGLKATLIGGDQKVIASATSDLSVSRPHSGWSEQDPADWIAAAEAAVGDLCATNGREMTAVAGIGLSGQMHGATLVDTSDRVLRPCMLWNDTRAHAEAAALDADERFRRLTGNLVFPGFTAAKTQWVRAHEPEIFARVAKVLLPKDYLRWWLTGEFFSDMSDASGTSWLDVGRREWSGTLLEVCGLNIEHMPALAEGSEPAGTLRGELASRWGMRNGIVVAGGAGDNAASAVGMGTVNSGDAFVSLGTSGVLFAATDRFSPKPESAVHAFCHALPGMWHQMGVILSATDTLNWLAAVTGTGAGELVDALQGDLQPPSGVTFLPYLSGERTPHNDARIRGALKGIEHASDRKVMTHAVLEGITFALRDNLAALESAGTRLESLLAVGGGSRSPYWLEMIATVLGVPVNMPEEGEFGAAFGAARLGMLADSEADWREVCTPPRIARTIKPATHLTGAYDEAYQRFRTFYQQIREY
jgi:xylulokinase